MSFLDDVARARTLLAESGRMSLRGLRRQFDLDDDTLEEFVEELVDVQQVARRDGNVLVWVGEGAASAPVGEPPPAPETRPEPAPTPAAPEPASHAGERRQITVLFCDLVDSTRLSASVDPEDWREVVRSYQQAAGEAIARFEGHVAQYLGDGILAYFGHPVAHEDDAERAVRAALFIVRETRALNESLPGEVLLQVRVGIHSGPVVIGEMGEAGSTQVLALGKTTNVAARLQDQAGPDGIVISGQTRRLVQGSSSPRTVAPGS
jgi:class 3 adenylate cyclase